jgi:hypothetical protein
MGLFLRWPVMKALRNRIRRIISTDPVRRKLKMDVLETERLLLRKLEQDDLRDLKSKRKNFLLIAFGSTGFGASVHGGYC